MAETHDIRIVVDASQAKRELDSFNASLGKVSKSLGGLNVRSGGGFDRLSQQVGQLADGFSKLKSVSNLGTIGKDLQALGSGLNALRAPSSTTINNISALSKALKSLHGVSISKTIGSDLNSLGNGLNSIRIPNLDAIKRLPALMRELSKAGSAKIGGTVAGDLKTLGDAFKGFRVPSDASIQRIPALLNSLKGVRINPNIAQGLQALSTTIGSIRAPSATAITNLTRLIGVLGTGNVGQVTAMANALSKLNGLHMNIGAPRQATPGVNARPTGGGGGRNSPGFWQSLGNAMSGTGGHARGLSGEMRGLENAFSASYQAASIFRTAIGAITLGELASGVLEAGNNLLTFRIALDSVATSNTEVGEHMAFVKKLADETGGSLSEMIPAYQRLAGAMRSLGKSSQDTQDTFAGFQKAMSAMHINPAEQAKTMRELMETFAMGGGHATQIMRGMASHIPSLTGVIQDTLHINGEQLRKKFEEGGLKPEEMVLIGKALGEKYASGVEEGLNHSQAAINKFKNQLTLFQQSVFDNGFDSGLRAMLESITGSMKGVGMEELGKKVGEGFREAFAHVGAFMKLLIELREPLLKIALAAAGIAAITTAFAIAGAAVSFLLSPVGMLTAATILLISQWDTLKSTLSGSADSFMLGWEYIKGAAGALIDGNPEADKAGMAAAKAYFDGMKKGTKDNASAGQTARSIFDSFKDMFKTMVPEADFGKLDSALSKFKATVDQIRADSDPHGAASLSDKFKNAADEARKLHEQLVTMTNDEQKLFETLMPSVKATKELKDNLETIDKLLGKRHPGETDDKNLIGKGEVERLKEIAKYNALDKINPAAARIREMMDQVRVDAQFAGKSGHKDQWEEEKKVLEFRNELKKKGLDLDKEAETAMRALIKAQQELAKGGSNGFTQWANNVKTGVDMMNETVKSSMDTLASGISGGISNLIQNGKGQFKSFGQAVKAEIAGIVGNIGKQFLDAGIKSLMAKAMQGMFGTGFSDNIQKALGGASKYVDKATAALNTTAQMDVKAAVVNVYGGVGGTGLQGIGTSGVSAFTPSGINPAAMGGGVAPFASRPNEASASFNIPDKFDPRSMKIGESGTTAFGLNGINLPPGARMWGGPDTGFTGTGLQNFQSIPGYGVNFPNVVTSTGLGNIGSGASYFSQKAFGGGGNFNANSAAALIKKVGGSDDEARTLGAIAMAESSGRSSAHNPNAKTGDNSYGLWQINMLGKLEGERLKKFGLSSKEDLYNPETNARVALQMKRQAGGYGDWTTYTSGKYLRHLQPGAGSPGVDMEPTGSIATNAPATTQKFDASVDKLSKSIDGNKAITNAIGGAGQQTGAMTVNAGSVNVNGGVGSGLGSAAGGSTPSLGGASAPDLSNAASAAPAAADSGGGGMFGGLGSMFSGLGSMSSMAMPLLGLGLTGLSALLAHKKKKHQQGQVFMMPGGATVSSFAEGGITGSGVSSISNMPTSFWAGAPHYAEGTPNTSGGMPAVLHNNEAVVPLSRGREIPVKMIGDGGQGGNMTVFKQTVNLQAKDHDSFRRNSGQVASDMQRQMGRMAARNN